MRLIQPVKIENKAGGIIIPPGAIMRKGNEKVSKRTFFIGIFKGYNGFGRSPRGYFIEKQGGCISRVSLASCMVLTVDERTNVNR